MNPLDYLNKLSDMLHNRVTPEDIAALPDDGVFVFGSKPDGNHAKGAARIALEKFGATSGMGEGFSGQSYAIPVHKHRTKMMSDAVGRFIDFVRSSTELKFYVLPIGCGSAQMNVDLVADMFREAVEMDNVFLPLIFIKSLRKTYRIEAADPLPVRYVNEEIGSAVLQGRAMGLMMEISKRTDDPITFDDRILKENNILLHAFLRTAKVTTPEENRVLTALMEEAKNVSEHEKDIDSFASSLMFVKGWKFDAVQKLEEGGSIYDLLEFSNKENIARKPVTQEETRYEDRIIGEYRNTTTCIEVQGGTLAVARDFAISLEPDGCGIRLHGNNPDFRELCGERRHNFVKLTAGFDGYMALDDRGHIHPGPIEREFQTGYELSRLENVVDVVSCEGHTVALHSDGTVTCVDEPSSYEGPERFAGRVETWTDIKQVACGFDFVLGLKSDGTLISVSAGNYYRTPDWHGVRQVDAFNCYYGNIYTIAVLEDGSVVADFCDDVAAWADVKKVVVGGHGCAIGLKNDGSLYAVGNEIFVRKVSSWRNVIDVECKFDNAIALLADGSVVSTF